MTRQQPHTNQDNRVDPHRNQDRELMAQIVDHDQAALATLYERYSRAVFSLAYRVLNNP